MNHREASRSHILRRLSVRYGIHGDIEIIAELKRQILEKEAVLLRAADYRRRKWKKLSRSHSTWLCFYDDKNIVVVYDELRGNVLTVLPQQMT